MSAAHTAASQGRAPSAFGALVAYTLRACLPPKRWFGVGLPCAGALLLGWLTHAASAPADEAFAQIAEGALFRLVLPLTCLVLGDAVLGADVRAGTFPLTWLSPVRVGAIAVGRWLGGWLVALVSLVPALALAPVIAGVPEAAGPMALAAAAGSAAYIALFLLVGALARRAAVWSLAIVLVGEWLLGGALAGVAQLSPLWGAQQVLAGLWEEGWRVERAGVPSGAGAVVRLGLVTVACLALATWRLRHLRPAGADD